MTVRRHVHLFRKPGERAVVRYMLDANIIADWIRDSEGRVAKRIARVGEDCICTSVIVAAELRYGFAKAGSRELLQAVEDLLDGIAVVPFDVPADLVYSEIRAELEAAGTLLDRIDLLIAAHARAADTTIVTADADKFERVRGLRVENWLAAQ